MKKIFCLTLTLIVIVSCTPKVGSKEWCNSMKEKDKGDWTMSEAKDYTKHCIF